MFKNLLNLLRTRSARAVSTFKNLPNLLRTRMVGWLIVSLVLTAAIGITAPQLLPVSLYKLSLITSAAWAAYWIDRSLFPYARPDAFFERPTDVGVQGWQIVKTHELIFCIAQIRRAIIIAAAMIAVALGA